MLLGYIDKEDRAYGLNFGTLRLRIRIEAGPGGRRAAFHPIGGSGGQEYRVLSEADVTVAVAMDHGDRQVPLLRPVPGRAVRHERGLLFIAAPGDRPEGDPTFFLVKIGAMPSAIRFFFEDQEGTEFVSIPTDEIQGVRADARAAVVAVSAENIALPKETLAYAVEFAPASRMRPLLEGLPMSTRG